MTLRTFLAPPRLVRANPMHRLRRAFMREDYRRLAAERAYQKAAFDGLKVEFARAYRALRDVDASPLITPMWQTFTARLERALLPSPPFTFLEDPTLVRTMFFSVGGRVMREELAYLQARLPEPVLAAVLREDLVGLPLLERTPYLTSHNSIHQLYHLIRFQEATGTDIREFSTIVEWGGGYGNLAKIVRRLHGNRPTYLIVDLPLLCCLQHLYLATVFGCDAVVRLQSAQDRPQRGKINLVPAGLHTETAPAADLFVSMWALSESSPTAMDLVVAGGWFGAPHLLLAYKDRVRGLPDAGRLGRLAAAAGAEIQAIHFLPGDHYVFK